MTTEQKLEVAISDLKKWKKAHDRVAQENINLKGEVRNLRMELLMQYSEMIGDIVITDCATEGCDNDKMEDSKYCEECWNEMMKEWGR